MRFSKVFFVLMIWAAVAVQGWSDKSEVEPNRNADFADAFSFPENLIGHLPGHDVEAGSPDEDYWSFAAIAGAVYRFTAVPVGVDPYVNRLDLALDIENSAGNIIARADARGDNLSEVLNWTAPSSATYYLVVYDATGLPNFNSSYRIECQIVSIPDTADPNYTGSAGIASLNRITADRAIVTWNVAQDDRTTSATMKYNVYYSTTQANVFVGTPKATFTGGSQGVISGLIMANGYYVGVRAQDEAGNEENNTVTLHMDPFQASAQDAWALYQ